MLTLGKSILILSRICRNLLFENDLIHRHFFLTTEWFNPTYQIDYLEIKTETIALYGDLIEVFESFFPSILYLLKSQ